jgi:hypothetical protein
MNPIRRTMSEAMKPPTVPPEALAIIEQGSPKPQTQNPTVSVDSVKAQAAPTPRPSAEMERLAKAKTEKGREGESVAVVTMTFRVPATIPTSLLKASSERKMKKLRPFTQQDIVAEALTAWLQKNGYQT